MYEMLYSGVNLNNVSADNWVSEVLLVPEISGQCKELSGHDRLQKEIGKSERAEEVLMCAKVNSAEKYR